MCGIAGGVNIGQDTMRKMLDSIKHRGTDNFNIVEMGNAICGANVLPLMNDTKGSQPVIVENNTLVFNGEIYNYKELAAAAGIYSGSDITDTKVLGKLMAKGNYDYNEIDGQFAFAVVNEDNITLVRDYPGIVPLFYSVQKGRFAFASESRCLELAGFEVVNVVIPGTEVTYNNGNIKTNKWIKFKGDTLKNPVDELDELMESAVRSQVLHGNPQNKVGIMLSGGVDSALLAYYMKLFKKEVYAFTIDGIDTEYAKMISDTLSLEHVILDGVPLYNDKADIYRPEQYNNHFTNLNNSLFVPTLVIAERAREVGIKILFSGDGIDELFGGYDIYSGYDGWVNMITHNMVDTVHSYSLERFDLAAMAHTIETRVPFLSRQIIGFAFNLDEQYKIRGKENKWIIRKIAEKYIPPEVAWRTKYPMQVSTKSYETLYGKEWQGSILC